MSKLLDSFHLNGLILRFQTNYKCALSLQIDLDIMKR